jgi:Flp pilus assembly protein TadD
VPRYCGPHLLVDAARADESLSAAEREFVNDMDVGKIYFNEKNYRGAELRFRDALLRKPHDEEAAFRLAESLDRQHKAEQAKEAYQSCLDLASGGQYGERSRKALERLQISSAKQK